MATFSTDRMGILEAWRRAGYTNAEELLGELLQQNDFLRVAAVAPANKGFFNETLRAKELGKGKVTDINGGIPSLASKTDKVSDPVIMFEGQSFVDERLFLGAPDPVAVRQSEDAMNLAGFSLSWNDLLVYGKPQDANGFSGLAARRSKIAGGHVLDMAGTTNLSSAYLIEFGTQGMRLLHAQHGVGDLRGRAGRPVRPAVCRASRIRAAGLPATLGAGPRNAPGRPLRRDGENARNR